MKRLLSVFRMFAKRVISATPRKAPQRGAILVLAASMIVVLLLGAVLAIDLTVLMARREQSAQVAKLAALAAIEKFFEVEAELAEKLEAARSRAEEIVGANVILPIGGQASASPGAAQLQPGRWHFAMREDDSNPCQDGANPPCFVPTGEGENPNAFRISGAIYGQSTAPIARALGWFVAGDVIVDAISTVVPRRTCILADMSGSMVRETHILQQPEDQGPGSGQGSEYAYFLQADNGTASASHHDLQWQHLVEQGPRPEGSVDPTVHWVDDYELRQTLTDENFLNSTDVFGNHIDFSKYHPNPALYPQYRAAPKTYRIDMFSDTNYRGPQPINLVYDSVLKMLGKLRGRAVEGDKLCIIFYDQDLSWPRIVNLTDDFDYLEALTNVSSRNDSHYGLERAIQHHLFPGKDAYTNTTGAVMEAMRQFQADDNENAPTNDRIILIGDGLPNCTQCIFPTAEDLDRYDFNGDGEITRDDHYQIELCEGSSSDECKDKDVDGDGRVDYWPDVDYFNERAYHYYNKCEPPFSTCGAATIYCGNVGCGNSYDFYWPAVAQLQRYVEFNLVPGRVVVDVVMLGEHVGPHTREVEDPNEPGVCLTDAQLRAAEGEHTNAYGWLHTVGMKFWGENHLEEWGEAYATMASDNPFFQANYDMYQIASMTGGGWYPIRPTEHGCTPRDTPECIPAYHEYDRQLTDPYCQPPAAQIDRYIKNLMKWNPYTVVFSK